MRIPIPGMNADALAKTSTDAKNVRRDFPVNPTRYSRFTGAVEKIEIKTIGEDEKLAVYLRNGDCLAEILVGLDIRRQVPGSTKSAEDQTQDNLSRLLLAVKVLGIALEDGSGIDEGKFGQARGRILAFSGKQTGTRIWENKVYPKATYFLDGTAQELVHVEPWTDGSNHAPAAPGLGSAAPAPFEIPF